MKFVDYRRRDFPFAAGWGLAGLTFHGPKRCPSPPRRPSGIAQGKNQTYIVADPKMYLEGCGREGAGGQFPIRLDGSREARWRFGWRLKASSAAILRQRDIHKRMGVHDDSA